MKYRIFKSGNGEIFRYRYEWSVIAFKNNKGKQIKQFKTLNAAKRFCRNQCKYYTAINMRTEEYRDTFNDSKISSDTIMTDIFDENNWCKTECATSELYEIYDSNGTITTHGKIPETHTKKDVLTILVNDIREYFFVPYDHNGNHHGTDIQTVEMSKDEYEKRINLPWQQRNGVYFPDIISASYYVND